MRFILVVLMKYSYAKVEQFEVKIDAKKKLKRFKRYIRLTSVTAHPRK